MTLSHLTRAVATAASVFVLTLPTPNAVATDVPFTATIDEPNFCLIRVFSGGVLAPNAQATQLSSYNAGGQSATADVRSFGFYELTATHQQVWSTSPIANNQDTTFLPFFSGTSVFRGVNFSNRDGNLPVPLPFISWTNVEIDL
ncbi:MAG: hypothetical protein AAGG69_14600, partial [Pseudomonadota bacterium]